MEHVSQRRFLCLEIVELIYALLTVTAEFYLCGISDVRAGCQRYKDLPTIFV